MCDSSERDWLTRKQATALGRSFEEGADYRFYYAALLPAVPDDPPRSSSVIYGFLHMLHPPEHLGETRTSNITLKLPAGGATMMKSSMAQGM